MIGFFLNNLWRWKCNLPECEHPKTHFYATDDKQHTTFNI